MFPSNHLKAMFADFNCANGHGPWFGKNRNFDLDIGDFFCTNRGEARIIAGGAQRRSYHSFAQRQALIERSYTAA